MTALVATTRVPTPYVLGVGTYDADLEAIA
jgi:hypothetical protein